MILGTFRAVPVTRYLSVEEKSVAVREWERLVAEMPLHVPLCGDERGFPDPPIIEWVRTINGLDGICTAQSCAGHRRTDGTLISGHLWLRFSRDVAARFDDMAMSLAAQSGIEQVSRLYTSWGTEVAAVVFHGNERNGLEQSMRVVVGFLRNLTTSGMCRSLPSSDTRCRVRRSSASCS